jgi:hypothetical protein
MSRERHNAIIDTIESGSMSAAVDAINQHMALAADQLAGPRTLTSNCWRPPTVAAHSGSGNTSDVRA